MYVMYRNKATKRKYKIKRNLKISMLIYFYSLSLSINNNRLFIDTVSFFLLKLCCCIFFFDNQIMSCESDFRTKNKDTNCNKSLLSVFFSAQYINNCLNNLVSKS